MNDGMVAPASFLREVFREREAAVGRASAAAARLAEALAELETERERRAEIEGERDLAVVRAELKEARHEAEKRAAALHAIEREAGSLRDAMAAARVLRVEISVLREKLAASEQQALQDAASRSALEGELVAAQSALTAAQQVGGALHALATNNSAPLDRLPRLGWRQAMRRWFGFAGGV